MGVRVLRAALCEGDELVAHVEKGHAGRAPAQRELEDATVEGERLFQVADLEGDVVDPHQAWAPGHLGSVGRDTPKARETLDAAKRTPS